MKRTITRVNVFGNRSYEFVDMPRERYLGVKDFKKMLKKKDFKIVALKNNKYSKKYFDDKDSRFLVFNTKYGMKKGYYTDSLRNENLVDEIITISK